jgi:hypothetical protein
MKIPMRIIFIIHIILLVNTSFAQNENNELLHRFNNCDSRITTNDVLTLLFQYQKIERVGLKQWCS